MCTISRTKNSERNLPPVSHPPCRNQQRNYRTLCPQESYRIFLLAIPSWSPAPTSFIPIERAHICRSRYRYINKTAIQDHHLRVTKYLRKPLAQEPYIIKDSSNASGKYKLNIATNLISQGYRHLILCLPQSNSLYENCWHPSRSIGSKQTQSSQVGHLAARSA
jgi:hypothetical protein